MEIKKILVYSQVSRTFDSHYFNIIANDASCKPWMGNPFEDTDLTVKVDNLNNYCFLTPNNDGGYILEAIGQGRYIAHTLALPSARGKPMAILMRNGFQFLFTSTDCVEIFTSVSDSNVNAKRWANLAGFKEMFRRDKCFLSSTGELEGETFYNMTYSDWVLKAPNLKEEGVMFHQLLESSGAHVNHEDDEVHDRFVGATILGCKSGNAIKAINLYNLWAMSSRYQPAKIIQNNCLLINIGNALCQMQNGSIEVIKTAQSH